MRFIGAMKEMIARVKGLRTLPVDEKYIQCDYVGEEREELHNLKEERERERERKEVKFIVFNMLFLYDDCSFD
jgi:hypothetical protein